jgi:hypothetical protein
MQNGVKGRCNSNILASPLNELEEDAKEDTEGDDDEENYSEPEDEEEEEVNQLTGI